METPRMAVAQATQQRSTFGGSRGRTMMRARAYALWGASCWLVACSGKDETSAVDTGMAAMPGMDMPASTAVGGDTAGIVFTATQVERGGIAWEPLGLGTVSTTAAIPGQILPNEDRTARLGAPAGGRVLAVRVAPGDRVTSGQVLAVLQSPEAGVAQADLAKAQAEVTSQQAQAAYAKAARDRAERLLALKAIPRQEYERAVADDELARAALSQAEAELRRARGTAEQLGAASSSSGEIVIRSPLAGVVLARTAVPGTVVEAGAPLVVVTDPSTLWLSINAPEALASLFSIGGVLRFTVPAAPTDTFAARVTAVGAGLDPETRTLPIRGLITSGTRILKPEMLASIDAGSPSGRAAALVPEDAVQQLDGTSVVFIAQPDTAGSVRFVARKVEIGRRGGGRVAIVHGLSAGELVVIRGALTVKAQLKKGSMPMEM
jgi:cobalt-zinc-cadmium efflux system membrane fusion protein